MQLPNQKRRLTTAITGLLFVTVLSSGLAGCTDSQQAPPNILILMADDAGWEDFGCYGNDFIKTPNIDQLARNGKQANNAFLTIAQCSPSRISILSGRYPHATGAEDLHMPLPDTVKLLPSMLKEKGYYTGLLKKSHLGENGDAQFDFVDPSLDAFDLFLQQSKDNPFFLWVGFTDPHRPYKKDIIDNPQQTDEVKVLPFWIDDQETREDLTDYYNEIRRMDGQIGQYIAILEKEKKLENTIVVFISDNGAPFPRAKGTVYDAGIKTPLIIQWPARINANQQTDALISLVDLAPSLLDIVGINSVQGMQGNEIKGLFSNENTEGSAYVFAERNWHNCDEHIRALRGSRFKLIKNAYTDLPHGTAADISNSPTFKSLLKARDENTLNESQQRLFEYPRPEYELYDLQEDPYELVNLIDNEQYLSVSTELKSVLEKWMDETNDFPSSTRRRQDNTDRFTGVKFDQTKLPAAIN